MLRKNESNHGGITLSQQLLNNLYILAIGFQNRRKCVAKCMLGDLLRDIELSSRRLNVIHPVGSIPLGFLAQAKQPLIGTRMQSQDSRKHAVLRRESFSGPSVGC